MALTTNLVSYYKLDESSGNAADSVGSNTLTNTGTTTYGAVKINNGAIFNGTSQYLSITNASQTGLGVTGDFSAAGWVVFTAYTSTTTYAYLTKVDYDTTNRSYAFEQNVNGTNQLGILLFNAGASTRKSVAWTPTAGTLYHIACVYTAASGAVDFYVNGAAQGTQQTGLPTAIATSTAPFELNGGFGSGTNPQLLINGKMDEWGFWSRTLSSSEVSQLYNSGAGFQYPFVSPLTPSVSDSSAVSDTPTIQKINLINPTADSTAIGETVTMQKVLQGINVSDSTAVGEAVTMRLFSNVNVTDSTAVSDVITLYITKLFLSVSDSSAVTDTPTIEKLNLISVTDSAAVSDTPTVFIPTLTLSVNDSTQVKEILTMGSVIVFDNTANFASILTSISGSYTTAGANRGLVAIVYSASSLFDIQNPTYGGVVMNDAEVIQLPAGYTGFIAAYYMTNPAIGANTFAVARTGTGSVFAVTVASYYNVQQDNSPDATSTATVLLSNTITATVAANFANDWTVMGVVSGLAATVSAGTNSFARTSSSPLWLFDSNGSRGAIGSYSMAATSSAPTDGMAAVILSIDPYIFFDTQPYFSEGDSVFVFDTPTLTVSNPQISVTDSTTISDTVTIESIEQGVTVIDSTAVGESINVTFVSLVSVSDTAIVSDTVAFSGTEFINTTDSTAVSDSATITGNLSAKGYSFVVFID